MSTYKTKKRNGVCVRCPNDADGESVFCPKHRKANRLRVRRVRREARAAS